MNYATWKLNFTDPNYGTGPEDKITELGFGAEASWSNGPVENGATILGYVTEALNPAKLTAWEFQNLSQEEALAFAKTIAPDAYLEEDGRISAAIEA
jgi:hypothetical protein